MPPLTPSAKPRPLELLLVEVFDEVRDWVSWLSMCRVIAVVISPSVTTVRWRPRRRMVSSRSNEPLHLFLQLGFGKILKVVRAPSGGVRGGPFEAVRSSKALSASPIFTTTPEKILSGPRACRRSNFTWLV